MTNEWYNNVIGKKLHEEYPKNFSVCDIDGVCRKFYKEDNTWKTRLVIYESKWKNEKMSQTQLATLYEIDNSFNWSKYDKYSGLYVVKILNDEVTKLEINKIKEVKSRTYSIYKIKDMDFDGFYNWISAKDKNNG